MRAKEVKDFLGLPYQRIQRLRKTGDLRTTPIEGEFSKTYKNAQIYEYDDESVKAYKKILDERAYTDGEILMSSFKTDRWNNDKLFYLDKLYGFCAHLQLWLPFERIEDIRPTGKSGRITVMGYSKNHLRLYIQLHDKYWKRARELKWIGEEWNFVFEKMNEIKSEWYANKYQNKKAIKKKWTHRRLPYYFPSEFQ